MNEYILEMKNISKSFAGVRALENVNFTVRKGEIHALVGENGAGKSTLMKILSGVYPFDEYEGELIFQGEKRKFSCIKDSEAAGVVIIYQELNIVKTLNVYENIFLGNEIKKNGIINANKEIRIADGLLKKVGLDIKPDTDISSLGVGKQQLIEIAKALNKKARLLILDEPTAPLTEVDAENLFKLLLELKKQGVTCIYISHKLDEIFTIADTITVLRDGNTIRTDPTGSFTMQSLISLMVGREMNQRFPVAKRAHGSVCLEVKNWTVVNPDNPEKLLLDNISFHADRGEILGIAGLVGAGRSELFMSLFGALPARSSGKMYINGKKIEIKNPADAIGAGYCYLTEDRKRFGLIYDQSIKDNLSLASLKKIEKGGLLNGNEETIRANKCVKDLQIKIYSLLEASRNLSGGNQQKVVIGKWLLTEPEIFVMDEPTRGVDVGAKYEIYTLMNRLVEKGVCVIMISSELPEILGMSDRIYVMKEGKISGELKTKETTQDEILLIAAGGLREKQEKSYEK
jgi:D-xylose transport system ATP-binding protein